MANNIILFDPAEERDNLLPLTFTRPVAEIRIGINTIRRKWEIAFPGNYSYKTQDYLAAKYPLKEENTIEDFYIAGNVCPSPELINALSSLQPGTAITCNGTEIARRGKKAENSIALDGAAPLIIKTLPDIFMLNDRALIDDFKALTGGRNSLPVSDTCTVIGDTTFPDGTPKLFLEPGAKAEGVIFNLNHGPVYIGRDAEIMEGTCVRGPLALCDHSFINMGSKIYGATTIGPYCKVGGEINNVVITGYSNKAHDGFLGNAVIGEWCNLGANCVSSNLKNDYSEIRLWNYPSRRFIHTGLQFCGLIMGDHTKAGINTMFNTATVAGVGCNIHGAGFPRTYIPSFSIGGAAGFSDLPLSKFFDTARRVMARRHVELTQADIDILTHLYETR